MSIPTDLNKRAKVLAHDKDMETLGACPACSDPHPVLESEQLALWRCAACAVLFNNPRPTQEFIEKNYNDGQYYARFVPDRKWDGMWKRRLERVLKHRPRSPILDVSAGIGTAVKRLREKGFDSIGSEISKEALARAKELNGVQLVEGYPEDLQLEPQSLGCIMMWHVFEHLPFPGRALRYLSGKLMPGGLLVIAVPNASFARLARRPRLWFAPRDARLEMLVGRIDYGKKFQEIHLIHFTPQSLRRLVETAGFAVEHLGVDNTLSEWRDGKVPLRNFAARWLGFNDAPAMLLVARKPG